MYLLYEHLKDSDGVLLATDMLLSEKYPGRPGVWIKNLNVQDTVLFLTIKDKIFKAVPIAQRNYDPDTHIWSFFSGVGTAVYKAISDSKLVDLGLKIQKIESLAEQVKAKFIAKPVKAEIFDPADFFYTPAAPIPSGPSKEQAEKKLKEIFMLSTNIGLACLDASTLKKHYRTAAMRLHPDRNAGDSNGMTELNYLWQVYNA